MCGENCSCGARYHHGPRMGIDYPLPLMDVDDEVKMLEEYTET